MKFQGQTFKFVMDNILSKIHFKGNNISEHQDWVVIIDLSVQDLIKASPNDADEIRFIVKALEVTKIIQLKEGKSDVIESLTPNGYKWILKNKYNMQID